MRVTYLAASVAALCLVTATPVAQGASGADLPHDEPGLERNEVPDPPASPRDNAYAAAEVAKMRQPDHFVAIWLEGEDVHVQFTKRLSEAEERALRSAVPLPDRMIVDKVVNSLSELQRIHARVFADKQDLAAQGIEVTSVGYKHNFNRVSIGVAGDSAAAEGVLHERYGEEHVVVTSRSPRVANRNNAGPPWRGGVVLDGEFDTSNGAIGYSTCTSAFVFRRRSTQPLVAYDYYMGTAGHCFQLGSPILDGRGVPIGAVNTRFWYNLAPFDFEAIPIQVATKSNRLTTRDPRVDQVQRTIPYAIIGDIVCKSGQTTNETCGAIDEIGADITYPNGYTIRNFAVAVAPDIDIALPGDSGGPVYSYQFMPAGNVMAYGIVSGIGCYQNGGCPEMYFSEIRDITYAIGMEPVSLTTP